LCKNKPMADVAFSLTRDLLAEIRLSTDAAKTRVTSFDEGFAYLGTIFVRGVALRAGY
jgi:hypothetical protein